MEIGRGRKTLETAAARSTLELLPKKSNINQRKPKFHWRHRLTYINLRADGILQLLTSRRCLAVVTNVFVASIHIEYA